MRTRAAPCLCSSTVLVVVAAVADVGNEGSTNPPSRALTTSASGDVVRCRPEAHDWTGYSVGNAALAGACS